MTTQSESVAAAGFDPLTGYAAASGVYDEMLAPGGEVRRHWQPFIDGFRQFDHREPAIRAQKLRRLVRENGIAQDLFSKTAALDEPWRIDLAPLLFAPDEWAWLERSLIQRARLFEALLGDLYGEQKLLSSGRIPPAVIFGDPTFIRPLRGAQPGRGRLAFYAADLARGPDGRWRIIDSHAETIAGMGFVLANRVVHSHIMGDLFAACQTLRLAPFFDLVKGELAARAGRDDAVIGLLTPGPHHEDYFGHAYMARYIGLQLVEGGDLRVVGNGVSIKSLEGLKPVDLLIRCVEGARSDPLELDPGSTFGPPGFMRVLRKTPDLSANAVGTAIIENRGLGPYLAAICRDMLGEELTLWDTPRWWLGEAGARGHVFAAREDMVIRPAHEGTGRPGSAQRGVSPAQLSAGDLAALKDEIGLHGADYVAEQQVGFASVPSWTLDGFRPKPFAVRLYAARIKGEYHVMPGGIALDVGPRLGVALHAPEGHSRDVWALSHDRPPAHSSRLRLHLDMPAITRGGAGLRSRIADNLYWLGRYAERADWTMRLMRGALSRLEPDMRAEQHREVVVTALEVLLAKDKGVVTLQKDDASSKTVEQLVRSLFSGRARNYGLTQTLDRMHHVASLIRDRLSVELWRTLQKFQASSIWLGNTMPEAPGEMLDYLDDGIATLAAFNGMAAENMTRTYAWTFMEIGRRLERAVNISEVLLALFGDAQEEAAEASALHFALEAADSTLTYRSRYLFAPALPLVLDLLLVDETNPRSVAFQLQGISKLMEDLPKGPPAAPQMEERKLILGLHTQVRLLDVHDLAQAESGGERLGLKRVLSQLNADLPRLSEAITSRYFNLTEDEVKRVGVRVGPRP